MCVVARQKEFILWGDDDSGRGSPAHRCIRGVAPRFAQGKKGFVQINVLAASPATQFSYSFGGKRRGSHLIVSEDGIENENQLIRLGKLPINGFYFGPVGGGYGEKDVGLFPDLAGNFYTFLDEGEARDASTQGVVLLGIGGI